MNSLFFFVGLIMYYLFRFVFTQIQFDNVIEIGWSKVVFDFLFEILKVRKRKRNNKIES